MAEKRKVTIQEITARDFKWTDPRCIICTEPFQPSQPDTNPRSATREHFIPECIGGILWSKLLCRGCNSRLGHEVERTALSDPAIRLAADARAKTRPELLEQMNHLQKYIINKDTKTYVKDGALHLSSTQPDGSEIKPHDAAKAIMRAELKQAGKDDKQMEEVMAAFDLTPAGETFPVTPELQVMKWSSDLVIKVKFDLVAPAMSSAVPMKIAYEFIVLHLRNATPPLLLQKWRQVNRR